MSTTRSERAWALLLIAALFTTGCDRGPGRLRRADRAVVRGDLARAVTLYRLAADSDDPDTARAALARSADLHRDRLDDPASAESICEELVSRYPGTDEAATCLQLMAEQRRSRQDWWGAIDAYRELLAQRPDDPSCEQTRHAIAQVYIQLGEPEQAMEEWTDLLELFPDSQRAADALLGVARCHDLLARCGMAIAVYRRVQERFAGSEQAADAMLGEAGCLETQGDLDGAEAVYRAALELHSSPDLVEVRLQHLARSRELRDPVVR
jgi:TolA-binding protein